MKGCGRLNRAEYKEFVRFRLSKLRAANAHHDFEHLCFELARKRVAPNLMEATGPVGAGGDQGRDSESYKTYLVGALGSGAFVSRASGDSIVGACTLKQDIVEKITADLATIFSREPTPNRVVYFCEADVPVGKRHELERKCRETYAAELTIFDGANITNALVDDDTRWIAEQYLGVAESLAPEQPTSARYQELRNKWRTGNNIPANFADFLEIRSGLRTAAATDEGKGDLARWLALMRPFTEMPEPKRLLQRARYEIGMAELRGNFSLDPSLDLWRAFFADLREQSPAEELADASVLLLHGLEAMRRGQASLAPTEIKGVVVRTEHIIGAKLATNPSTQDRITLLEAKSLLLPLLSTSPGERIDALVTTWREIVETAKETPFSPVLHIGKMMMELNRHLGADVRFRTLNAEVDNLIAERTGEHEAATRAKARALDQLKAGRRLAALDEFHRARIGYFTDESIVGSILAMLILSQIYEELHLHYAARYYAAAALFMAVEHPGDDTKRLVGRSALRLATSLFMSGEGMTFLCSFANAMDLHNRTAEDSEDWEKHEALQQALLHATIFRAAVRTLAPQLLEKVDGALDLLPIDTDEITALKRMSDGSPWGTMSEHDLRRKIGEEVGPTLFADIGAQREIEWMALGIRWTIRHGGDQQDRLSALELGTTLQIVQAELAQLDLVVVPSDVIINVSRSDSTTPTVLPVAGNVEGQWDVTVPKDTSSMSVRDTALHAMAISVMCLRSVSALPDQEFDALVEQQMEGGLPDRALVARPVGEMLRLAIVDTLEAANLQEQVPIPSFGTALLENHELSWRTDPGPHYSPERAKQALQNRYKYFSGAIRNTLLRC